MWPSNGPHNALRHHWLMPISCHFQDCKALLVTSLTHVSGAIAGVQTFTFSLYLYHTTPNIDLESWSGVILDSFGSSTFLVTIHFCDVSLSQ